MEELFRWVKAKTYEDGASDDERYETYVGTDRLVEDMFCLRTNNLSLTTPQWFSLIRRDETFRDLDYRHDRILEYLDGDKEFLHMQDLVTGEKVDIGRFGFAPRLNFMKTLEQDHLCALTSTVKYRGVTVMVGTCLRDKKDGNLTREAVEAGNINARNERKLTPRQIENFHRLSGGDMCLFVKDKQELAKVMNLILDKDTPPSGYTFPELKPESKCLAVFLTKDNILQISPYMGECINAPGNRFYSRKDAEEKGFSLYTPTSGIFLTYDVARALHGKGYFGDCRLISSSGVEFGRKILRDNGEFMIDYFYGEAPELPSLPAGGPASRPGAGQSSPGSTPSSSMPLSAHLIVSAIDIDILAQALGRLSKERHLKVHQEIKEIIDAIPVRMEEVYVQDYADTLKYFTRSIRVCTDDEYAESRTDMDYVLVNYLQKMRDILSSDTGQASPALAQSLGKLRDHIHALSEESSEVLPDLKFSMESMRKILPVQFLSFHKLLLEEVQNNRRAYVKAKVWSKSDIADYSSYIRSLETAMTFGENNDLKLYRDRIERLFEKNWPSNLPGSVVAVWEHIWSRVI